MTNSDETTFVRTLPPDAFESIINRVAFKWYFSLDKFAKEQIRQKVQDASDSGDLEGMPTVAIVCRPGEAADEDDVTVDLYDGLGKKLRRIKISENGLGAVELLS